MATYWPQAQKTAHLLYDQLSRKYPVDLDQMESDALDFVIDNVRKLTDHECLTHKLAAGIPRKQFLKRQLVRQEGRRSEQARPDYPPQLLESHYAPEGESVEDFLSESGVPLKGSDVTILKAVMYKRSGESLEDAIANHFQTERQKEWAYDRWRTKLLPKLREWARRGDE